MTKENNSDKVAKTKHFDYKDIITLNNYINPHARILSRQRSGLKAKQQRNLARAIKRSRFMALIPYIKY